MGSYLDIQMAKVVVGFCAIAWMYYTARSSTGQTTGKGEGAVDAATIEKYKHL